MFNEAIHKVPSFLANLRGIETDMLAERVTRVEGF